MPQRLLTLDDGGVSTRAVRPGVGPGGDTRRVPGRAQSGAPDRGPFRGVVRKAGVARDDVDLLTVL